MKAASNFSFILCEVEMERRPRTSLLGWPAGLSFRLGPLAVLGPLAMLGPPAAVPARVVSANSIVVGGTASFQLHQGSIPIVS